MKKRRGKVDVGAETRRRAREKVGLPPTERVILDKRRKPPKHRKKSGEEENY